MSADLLFIAAGIAVYWISLVLFPYRNCWWCSGRKGRNDRVFTGAWGRCWICKGTGKRIRLGVALFRRKAYRAIRDGKTGRNY